MRKYEYINSEIEWLDTVPKHWKVDRIKDKTTDVVGGDWGNDPESEVEGKNIVVLRVADLDGIYFNYDELTVRKIKESSFISRKVTDRSLIIEKSGGGEKQLVGRVGYPLGMNFDAICSNFMAKIDFDKTVDIKFANYVLSSLYSSKLNFPFVQQTTGIQNLNVTYYLNSKFPFPPLPEQKAIADYLDKACHRIDKIIEIKERQLEKLEEIKLSEIYKACILGLNNNQEYIKHKDGIHIKEFPSHWRTQKLKRGCKQIDTGGTPKTSVSEYFENGTIEWYGPESFNESINLFKPKKMINEKAVKDNQIKIYPENSVFFVGVGATAGKVGIIRKPASCNQQINVLKTNYKLLPDFLAYQLKVIEKEIIKFAQYTTLPILNQTKTGQIEITTPPINEQKQIVEHLNNYIDKLYAAKKNIKEQISVFQSYRKSLIHECVTGKKQVWEGEIKQENEYFIDK